MRVMVTTPMIAARLYSLLHGSHQSPSKGNDGIKSLSHRSPIVCAGTNPGNLCKGFHRVPLGSDSGIQHIPVVSVAAHASCLGNLAARISVNRTDLYPASCADCRAIAMACPRESAETTESVKPWHSIEYARLMLVPAPPDEQPQNPKSNRTRFVLGRCWDRRSNTNRQP
jgi:hypothetical protein